MRRPDSIEANMRVRPRQNGSWLFPVMVVAAAMAMAFGALGLALVTGHLRDGGTTPPADQDGALVTAQAVASPVKAAAGAAVNPAGTLGSN